MLYPKQAYQIYDAKGNASKYDKLLREAARADVILFGELHNNPIAHWLQYELTKDLHEQDKKQLVLGAEMFEADNQLILDEYLTDFVSAKNFEKETRLWPNYSTDYKPLVNYAKAHKLPFVATNIPRRYASMVFKQGIDALEGLSETAKQYIAPLPIEVDVSLPGYKAMLDMNMGGHGGPEMANNLPHAQAVKDATMAHFISKNWQRGQLFMHYNGAYHSNNYEGIVWYLKKYAPKLKVLTIATTEQADISSLNQDMLNSANFVLCIPETMTKTH